MTMKTITYADARSRMKPGDVIAFGGNAPFSLLTKFVTQSYVSHVGVILQSQLLDETSGRYFNQIVESTELNGFTGVQINRFSDRMNYDGEIWWLPLNANLRQQRFDQSRFFDFLFNQAKLKKSFDIPQALMSAFDLFDGLRGPGYNREDTAKFFCSELVAAGFEVSGLTGTLNCAEVTPIDLCRWAIYEPEYYLLKGDVARKISRYNSCQPQDWNC